MESLSNRQTEKRPLDVASGRIFIGKKKNQKHVTRG